MRIYFGRLPEGDDIINLDVDFMDYLVAHDYNFNDAVDTMVSHLLTNWDEDDFKDVIIHTINPLIINFFTDDFAKEYLWMIDEEGNHINMGTDDHMLIKMDFLSPGEVMCDDYRSFT